MKPGDQTMRIILPYSFKQNRIVWTNFLNFMYYFTDIVSWYNDGPQSAMLAQYFANIGLIFNGIKIDQRYFVINP